MDLILTKLGLAVLAIIAIAAAGYVLAWADKPKRDPNVLSPEKLARYDMPDELDPIRRRKTIHIHRDRAS